MQVLEQYLTMKDGHHIYSRSYVPNIEMIGHIHIFHGMAEHCRRYDAFATILCERGYVVSMHDHRGHGYTAERNGSLGFIAPKDGFQRLVDDAYEVLCQIQEGQQWPNPIILGHSMGSFVARRFIQLYSEHIQGVILSGTASTTPLHHLGKYIAKTLANTIGKETPSPFLDQMSFGGYNKAFPNTKTAFDWLSTDEIEVQKYVDDPYCGFVASTQFFVDITSGLVQIAKKSEIERIRHDLPILLVSGAQDPVGDFGKGPFYVAQQYSAVGLTNVTVHLFENMRHEILNEKQRQQVYAVILRWLEKYDKKED